MRQRLPIATKNSQGRSVKLSAELLTNMYAEQAPDGALSPVVARSVPGFALLSNIGTAFVRGLHWVPGNETLWCLVGTTLYKISESGTASSIGTVGGYGRASMADNGTQLIITTEAITYIVTLASDTLTAVTDSDFPNADTVAFLGGYFFFNNNQVGTSGQLFWSEIYEGTTYDALDFATAENVPDNLVAVWRDHDRLLLFGDRSIESWFLTGGSEIVAPYKGSVINRGLGARWSVANVDNSVIFLDDSGIVRRIGGQGGYSAERISTHAIEYEISQGSWRHDDSAAYDGAFASSYIEEGHEFYVLTVPNNGTYCFDAATGVWHKRKSRGLEHCRTSFHVRAFNNIVCGDTETGKLYTQSLDYADEAGDELVSEVQFPQIYNNGDRFRVHEIELLMDGQGGLSGTYTTESTVTADTNDLTFDIWGETAYNIGAGQEYSGSFFGFQSWFQGYLGGLRVTDGVSRYYPDSQGNIPVPTSQFPIGATDPHWDNVVTLLHFDGADGSTTFDCEKGNTVTSHGGAVHSNAQSKWGTTSGYFDGVNDRLRVDIGAAAQLGAALTIEAWAYPTATNAGSYGASILSAGALSVSGGDTNFTIYDDNLRFTQDDINSSPNGNQGSIIGDSIDVPLNKWSHLAAVRYSELDIWLLFVNGQLANGGTTEYTLTSTIENADSYGLVMLDAISDGNKVSDITQEWRQFGIPGKHDNRVIWRRLGQHRHFTPRFTISSNIRKAILNATARISTDG